MTKMRQWTVMTVVAVVVVLAGGWLLLVKPQGSKISAVKAQATTQEQANQVLQQEIAARLAQEKTLPAEQAQLQKLSVQVPTAPDEPGIIRALQSSSSGAGVNLLSITPGSASTVTAPATGSASSSSSTTLPTTSANLLVLPVSMSVVGSYANVESYLQLLEKLPRSMLVTQFSLCPIKSQAGTTSSCSPVTVPSGTTVADGALGASISADVFFAPTATAAAAGAPTTLSSSTAPSTTTTTTPSTPASPAATPTPAPTATASN